MTRDIDEIHTASTQTLWTAGTRPSPPRARAPAPRRRMLQGAGFPIRYKIFLFVLTLIASVLAATVVIVQIRATAVTRASIEEGIRTTGTSFAAFIESQFNRARTAIRQLADDPGAISAFAETKSDHQTMLDYLQAKLSGALAGVDSVMAIDERGMLIARTDVPGESGDAYAEKSPLFSRPLMGEEASGFGQKKGGALVLVASAPVREGGTEIKGELVFSYPVQAAFAAEARAVTNADSSFFTVMKGSLNLVVSTLAASESEALRQALASNPQITNDSMGKGMTVGPVEVSLEGDRTILIAVPLASTSGDRIGLFVATRSLYREMAPYRQNRNTLLEVGCGALLIALVISFLMAGRMTRPLTALLDATEQVADGNLDVEIPRAPNDEVGMLARAFQRMLMQLRQKAELEEYLRNLRLQGSGERGTTQMHPHSAEGTTVTPMPVSAAALTPGMLFNNRYEILQSLGAGAMGNVYRARDRVLDEEIAIKTIRGEVLRSDPLAIDRFKQEIKLARRITHKHVLRTYDFGEIDGVLYITMEYMKGVTLKYVLGQRKALPLGPGCHLARQICLGLAAAHEQGVIHRDVKPQNMLVNDRGELKLMDFGIARRAEAGGMTEKGIVIGTPHYMSPEQISGKEVDARSDIYSTGVVLYEMFTGALPFDGATALEVVLRQLKDAPPPPRSIKPDLPIEIERLILKAMAKDPAQRYQALTDLHDDLASVGA